MTLKTPTAIIVYVANMPGFSQIRSQISFFLYSPCHYMRAWIRILEAPSCYEHAEVPHRQRESPQYKHRLQLSLNLQDSPGFLATGRLYYNGIIGSESADPSSVVLQQITYWW